MMAFWSWHSALCHLQKVPPRTMRNYNTYTVNGSDSENRTTTNDTNEKPRCLSCGEQRTERYKLTLRQPLRGNGYGRIIDTGSVCEQCASKLRLNARTEVEQ
jgi:transposase-like protein